MSYFSSFSEKGSVTQDGGKGFNLKKLTQFGANVPGGFVLKSEFYSQHFPKPPEFDFEHETKLESQCQVMVENVLNQELPEAFYEELDQTLATFSNETRFAVRSSSTFEDLGEAAFAGQHDTFLNIGREDVAEKIQKCFASLWHKHAVLYRKKAGFSQANTSMAVVIQAMIPADVAGVSFAIDPVSGHPNHVLIEANWGVGESVVGGEAITDSWVVDYSKKKIVEARVQEKQCQEIVTETGTQTVEIVGAQRLMACLTTEQIMSVCQSTCQISRMMGAPQDMEWAFYKNQLFILQARPQTTIPPRFTRDESAERFPDPLTPLTWSCVKQAFNHSLEYSLELMHLSLPTRPWFDVFDHYVYGNQNAVLALSYFKPFEAQNFEELAAEIPRIAEKYRWVMDLPQQWMRDLDHYLLRIGALNQTPFDSLSCSEFQAFFDNLLDLAVDYFKPNIAISLTQGLLTKTLGSIISLLIEDPLEANDLLKKTLAAAETKTALINRELFQLAKMADQHPSIMSPLSKGQYLTLQNHSEFWNAFQRFLDHFGHREISFDFYQPTWAEAPEVVLDLIYLMAKDQEGKHPHERELEVKKEQALATQFLFEKTPKELHFFLQELLRLTLNFTFLDDLEHFQTTRLNLLARRSIGKFGEKLKLTKDPYDLFFLKWDELKEIDSFQSDKEKSQTLQAKIQDRKNGFQTATRVNPPWQLNQDDSQDLDSEGSLKGVPGSPGVCEGFIYLVHGPQDFRAMPNDAILVARTTNPAWTPLFYKAKGIITESGGPLSHGAVTARELGIPAVMNIKGCMQSFQNGERVRINGKAGSVIKL